MTHAFWNRFVLAFVFGLVVVGCDDLVDDSSFQLWCDDAPCAWTIEEGAVSRAPTWHERDYGISLEDDPTAISQLVPGTRLGYECMRFEIISSAERGSELRVELDFQDDGVLELERTLDRSAYAQDVFFVGVPSGHGDLRIRLVKYGPGEAVIAQLRVQGVFADEGCLGPSP